MRILFAGTDHIAVPLLEELNKSFEVCAVFSAPDSRGKRGNTLIKSPIKEKAESLSIPVFTPISLKKEERNIVSSFSPDILLSFCYGKIFGPKFLSLFPLTMNVHPSLLPEYRGASPIYASILNRNKVTGISLQKIDLEVDSGDLYDQIILPLDGRETTKSLTERVSLLVPEFVVKTLSELNSKKIKKQEGKVTYQNLIEKKDGHISWDKSAEEIHALIRASYPWPKAQTTVKNGESIALTGVFGSVFDSFEETNGEEPGTVVAFDKEKGLKVATGSGYLYITSLLPEAKKEMDARSFYNGNRWIIGEKFGV